MRNEKGMTLIEIIIALTLSVVGILFITQFMEQTEQTTKDLQESIEQGIEKRLGAIVIDKDITAASISFNQIYKRSDTANVHGSDFFYYSPCKKTEKNITLQKDAVKEIFFLTKKSKHFKINCHSSITSDWHYCKRLQKGLLGIYDPMNAFTYTPPPDWNTTPPLVYKAANQLKNHQGQFIHGKASIITRGTLLAFIVPIMYSPCNPEPYPVFVGYTDKPLNQSTFQPIDIRHISEAMDAKTYNRIFSNSSHISKYTKMEVFLRKIPSVGGNSPIVFIMPVQLVHYYISKDERGNHIYRELIASVPRSNNNRLRLQSTGNELNLTNNTSLIYEDIEKLIFKRPSLSSQVIQVKPFYKKKDQMAQE